MASLREYAWKGEQKKTTIQVLWRENGRQHSATFDDRKVAELYKVYLEAEGSAAADAWLDRQTEVTVAQVVSLDEMVAHYIAHLTSVSEGTRAEYGKLYRRTYGPILGDLPVDAVNRDKVARATQRLGKTLAQKSVKNARGLLTAAYTYAVEHDDFPVKTHPCRNIRLPHAGDVEDVDDINYLTQAEFSALYEQIPPHWQPLVLTLAGTGMRWGEATALSPRSVDLRAGTVRIARAWKRVPGGWELGPPKTRKSRRTVTLPPELVPVLTEQKVGKGADDFLFTSRNGSHVHHANFRQRVWVPAIKRAQEASDLSKTPRIHDLRHSHVAWLIGAGVHLVTIQQRLGHESIQTTIDVYGDLMPDLQVQAAHAASQALAGLRQLPAGPA